MLSHECVLHPIWKTNERKEDMQRQLTAVSSRTMNTMTGDDGADQDADFQKTAARPFLECRLLNLFLPLMDSPSSPFRSLPAVGMLTPSSASLLPNVLVGLESAELRSLKVESPG